MEQGTKCALLCVIYGFSIRKLDLFAADLNRLQQRDIDKLITIAAISSVAIIEH